jgi:hypothetical protein
VASSSYEKSLEEEIDDNDKMWIIVFDNIRSNAIVCSILLIYIACNLGRQL